MGKLPTGHRTYQIQRIWDNHAEALRRIALGQKAVDVARDMGYTPAFVSYTRNSDAGKIALAALEADMDKRTVDVGRRIREIAPRALDVVEAVIDNNIDRLDGATVPLALRVKTATDIMEKAGYTAPKRVEGVIAHGLLTQDGIEEIKRRALGRDAQEAEVVEGNEVLDG